MQNKPFSHNFNKNMSAVQVREKKPTGAQYGPPQTCSF